MLRDNLKVFPVLVLIILFLLALGFLVNSLLFKNIRGSNYFNLLIGTLTIVIPFALFKSDFLTVNTGFLIFPAVYFLFYWKSISLSNSRFFLADFRYISLIPMLLASSFFFLIRAYMDFIPGFGFFEHDTDIVYYSKISAYLRDKGIETSTVNYFEDKGPVPYHYFELWLNALVSSVTGILSLKSFKLITIPFLQTLLFCGVVDLVKKRIYTLYAYLIGIFIIFLSGTSPFFLKEISFFQNASTFHLSFMTPKLLAVAAFSLPALILWDNKERVKSLCFFLILPLISIATAPAILITASGILAWEIIIRKKFIDYRAPVVLVVGVALFLAIFYIFFGDPGTKSAGSYFLSSVYFKRIFTVMAGGGILMGAMFWVFFIVLVVYFRKVKTTIRKSPENYGVFILFTGATLLSWAIFHHVINSVQLFSIPFLAFFLIIVTVLLTDIITDTPGRWKFVPVTVLLLLIFFKTSAYYHGGISLKKRHMNHVSPEFIKEISANLGDMPLKGVFFTDTGSLQDVYQKHLTIYWPTDIFIPLFNDRVWMTSASIHHISVSPDPILMNIEQNLISSSLVLQLMEREKISESEAVKKLIKDHSVSFLVTGKSAKIPDELRSMVDKEFTDPVSGLKLYLLNPN